MMDRMTSDEKVGDLDLVVERAYRAILRPGDASLDAGAHLGRHTLPMADIVGSTGVVYAFEPEPTLAQRLTPCLPGNVKFHQSALADTCGPRKFVRAVDDLAYSGLQQRSYPPGPMGLESITVATETIDSVCLNGPALRFLKIDVEGGEYHLLLGARAVLEKYRPVFYMEHGTTEAPGLYGYDHTDFQGFLRGCGYEVFGFNEKYQYFSGWGDGCWNFMCIPRAVNATELMVKITAPTNL
jgi:FkbM family methyltransferase